LTYVVCWNPARGVGYHPTTVGSAHNNGLWALLAASTLCCVPEGPPTGSAPPLPTASVATADVGSDPPVNKVFRDGFERAELGANWRALDDGWAVQNGELCVQGAHNRGVWLKRRVPANARIRFDARADSPEGDIKVEAWGDGRSGASGPSYDDATSYILIFGGWTNTRHVLARLNEHGDDALLIQLRGNAEDLRERPVKQGQAYAFRIERTDGRTIRWYVDDVLVHERSDADPLKGAGHDHFGFNDWAARVCFDNLEIVTG
jgi:hypothetical protein